MSEYCIEAVRYVHEDLKAVRMGQWQAGVLVAAQETPVAQAVERIEARDTVRALLIADGRAETGPRLKVVPDEHGGKTLALDNAPDECLELSDLQRF